MSLHSAFTVSYDVLNSAQQLGIVERLSYASLLLFSDAHREFADELVFKIAKNAELSVGERLVALYILLSRCYRSHHVDEAKEIVKAFFRDQDRSEEDVRGFLRALVDGDEHVVTDEIRGIRQELKDEWERLTVPSYVRLYRYGKQSLERFWAL